MESEYTKEELGRFKAIFSSTWVDTLKWSASAKQAFTEGKQVINMFREGFVISMSKLVLSGDHLLHETKSLDELSAILNGMIEDVDPRKTLKSRLTIEYQSMLKDLIDVIRLVKNHIRQTKKRFQPNNIVISCNFIPFDRNRHLLVRVMDLVCDSCEDEYNFSYNDDYIRQLLLHRQYLSDYREKSDGDLRIVLNAVFSKIELLLGKLSAFTANKRILYYHDLELETIELDQPDKYAKDDFRFLFQKYLEPAKLDEATILEWQQESLKENVAMWQLAFLMRYYTKCTKSIQQIDHLIELANIHHKEDMKSKTRNVVNDLADRSFLNYMYNSRFSFLCQCNKQYTYEQMRKDLQEIEALQAQTFIMNYHPYQTAIDFSLKVLKNILSQNIYEDISRYVIDLKEYFQKFKLNVAWCKKNQPYLVQLRFNFSSITFEGCDFKTFCPSSFCRPLRFKDLDEKVVAYAGKIAHLEYEAQNQRNRKVVLEAKSKIDNMERKNMEQMGLFITITTFLVGLLSIFIGNNGSVSITEKMMYVIALGCILIIFVCFGYFAVREKYNKGKCWLFGTLMILSAISICYICRGSYINNNIDIKNKTEKQAEKNKNQFLIKNNKQYVKSNIR